MEFNELKPNKGSVKQRKRVGRGEGSGRGRQSTRGHNGALSRSGSKRKWGFEGGQMPIQKRVPKYGFKNINRKHFSIVNLDYLQKLADGEKVSEIDPELLRQKGLAKKNEPVKILGDGELKTKVTVKAHKFSASAKKAIEDQGGQAVEL